MPITVNRIKRIAVQPETLVSMAKGEYTQRLEVVANRLPPDATYLYATFDPRAGAVHLFIESATFDLVVEGDVVPELPTTVFQIVTAPTKVSKKRKPALTAPHSKTTEDQ